MLATVFLLESSFVALRIGNALANNDQEWNAVIEAYGA